MADQQESARISAGQPIFLIDQPCAICPWVPCALRGFEAAARLMSFTPASEELHITQSAISHQIRTLEDAVGVPLFVRQHRTVRLTDAGFEHWRVVRDGLSRLIRA